MVIDHGIMDWSLCRSLHLRSLVLVNSKHALLLLQAIKEKYFSTAEKRIPGGGG